MFDRPIDEDLQQDLKLVDAETKEIGFNDNYIDSMKRIREDILEDYGLHYGETLTDEKIEKLNA